jgi:hypothetical protein
MEHRTLQVGSREVVIETTALPTEGLPQRMRLCQPSQQLLVLKPSLRGGLIALAIFILILALGFTAFHAYLIMGMTMKLVLIGGTVGFTIFVGWRLLVNPPPRFEFDLCAGRMRMYSMTTRRDLPPLQVLALQFVEARERPLQQVLAVQLIQDPAPRRPVYQLNLVLDDEQQRRMNLSNHNNWEATRHAGKELAAFLGVPLLDEVSGEKTEESPL